MSIQSSSRATNSDASLRPDAIEPSHQSNPRITTIREKALETIRRHFPLTQLFTPELKIDLGAFIKDQMLFQRIAESLAPLNGTDSVNREMIAKHFENHELLKEIRAMFTVDPTPYLALFYDACADVINKKSASNDLKNAIEACIFTLRNGLVAQVLPQAIMACQVQHSVPKQELARIKDEGSTFIRESLRLHLYPLAETDEGSFKKLLCSNAEQLVPFVRKITTIYLRERGEICPDDPLTFRNPTGYNCHGMVAAIIMEVCLDVLGYATRVMVRGDLEPKVTLATAHSIVEVTGDKELKYLVDPCYIQFHKDICSDDALLPTAPVLVLEESEVEDYIENNLMSQWKANLARLWAGDNTFISELNRRDQLCCYLVQSLHVPKEFIPANPEPWVRNALRRVWSIGTYTPILSNRAFPELFIGDGSANKTQAYVKAMGIASLSHHSAEAVVVKRLSELLKDTALIGKNSVEAMSLMAQLPISTRVNYGSLLELDPRVKRLDITLNAYYCALRKIVNPEQKDLIVIYGCSGADCMTVMLATDAKDFIFVDLTPTTYQEFEEALAHLRSIDSRNLQLIEQKLDETYAYTERKKTYGGSSSSCKNGKHKMVYLALKILFDLQETGVDLKEVVLSSDQNGLGVRLEFPWKSHGALSSRMRSLTFVTADITQPEKYPSHLKTRIEQGFDLFYMKAAFLAPLSYPQFLPALSESMNEGGWLMTADKTFSMEAVNPEECLSQQGLAFKLHRSNEMTILEEMMIVSCDPLGKIPALEFYKDQRHVRQPGSDLSYWTILNLRQKISP